ncbi:hypothetical protein RJ641_007398 [Dillenia turbinata]|uniref:IRK-interacting protein n=1 Tax=Dillenia turbinata TaxID=194707 RepID=A0AAN8Z408_9MAGN
MATAATTIPQNQIFQPHNNQDNKVINNEVSSEEIKAAIAKAVELRALHAALMQGNSASHHSPASNFRFPIASPVTRPPPHFSAQDYPVFTPSYEEEPLPGYQQLRMESKTLSESWEEYGLEGESTDEVVKMENSNSRKVLNPSSMSMEDHICPADDHKFVIGSGSNHISVLQISPGSKDLFKSGRRNNLGDLKSVSSCNKCKPATISSETDNASRISKGTNVVVPLTDSHSSVNSQQKSRGQFVSWLFSRMKKKHKNETSPNHTESEDVSQVLKDLGIMSIETLKKELMEAHENRDAALMEVTEMRSSLGELKQKLDYLETHCEELKKALRQAVLMKDSQVPAKGANILRRGKSMDGNKETFMPVSDEVMGEGFLQIVSEARLSVKQLCKTLVGQIEETDSTLTDNLNMLLKRHKLSLHSKYSKAVLYHFEAIINQSLYQDFENCAFEKNGSPKHLDPNKDRQAQFASFVALRNLSWNEVLRKGTKYYSEEFSKFCDQKMSCIISTLNWTRPWPEQLLQSFFVAAKCIWLLHLLAFSFSPPLAILRVEENRTFDPHYMEDILVERQRPQGPSRVKIMVMPGFYVQDRALRCKVLCRYKSIA